jgi:hypothetical protein
MVHQKAVQMKSGKLHPLLPYPKCKVAVPRNLSIPNLRNDRCLSDPFHPINFNPTLKFEWLGSGGHDNELWIQLSWESGGSCQLFEIMSKEH